jgi:hypothetical protein
MAGALVGAGLALLVALGWTTWQASLEQTLRGVLVSVEARDIGHAAAVVVRSSDGTETRFLVDPSVDAKWTPGHLRDHMMFAQPMTVYYRRAGDALVAHRITD